MCFEIALEMQSVLVARHREAGKRLNSIEGIGSGPMGLTPDTVKASAPYREARQDYDACHEALRRFNKWFLPKYKTELRCHRQQVRETRLAALSA